MNSFRDLIDAFGTAALSQKLGVAQTHIRTMRARDSIGPLYWPFLLGEKPPGMRRPISIEFLQGLRMKRYGAGRRRIATHDDEGARP